MRWHSPREVAPSGIFHNAASARITGQPTKAKRQAKQDQTKNQGPSTTKQGMGKGKEKTERRERARMRKTGCCRKGKGQRRPKAKGKASYIACTTSLPDCRVRAEEVRCDSSTGERPERKKDGR